MADIPILNIYNLLRYAWDVLKNERGEIAVGALDPVSLQSLQNLFARELLTLTHTQRRRGLDRDYQPHRDEIAGLRGRLLITQTLRHNLRAHARAACEWDELETDTLPNRILKATLRELRADKTLDKILRDEIHDLLRWFAPVQDIRPATRDFYRVQLHGNNRPYALLLHICQFIHEQLLPDQRGHGRRFRDFERDALPKLFEKFVLNFYRRELPTGWQVTSPQIDWHCETNDKNEDARKYLPAMQTDVCLLNRANHRAIILDTKFYAHALKEGPHGTPRLPSGNLYQLNTYLRQRTHEPDWEHAEGILLYPRTDTPFDASFTTDGHRIRALTLDLYRPWPEIADNLKAIAQPPSPQKPTA